MRLAWWHGLLVPDRLAFLSVYWDFTRNNLQGLQSLRKCLVGIICYYAIIIFGIMTSNNASTELFLSVILIWVLSSISLVRSFLYVV